MKIWCKDCKITRNEKIRASMKLYESSASAHKVDFTLVHSSKRVLFVQWEFQTVTASKEGLNLFWRLLSHRCFCYSVHTRSDSEVCVEWMGGKGRARRCSAASPGGDEDFWNELWSKWWKSVLPCGGKASAWGVSEELSVDIIRPVMTMQHFNFNSIFLQASMSTCNQTSPAFR